VAGGFTLIELMMVLVIVAVVMTIALPSFSVIGLRTKLKSYSNDLVASVYLARGEAIKRNASVRLCASSDGIDCAAGGDWDQGWLVIDPNDTVIRYQQGLSSGIKLFGQSSVHTMTFEPSGAGVVMTPPGSVTQRYLTLCQQSPDEADEARRITVSAGGKSRIEKITGGCP
jgi:type IV fimbrial biogenesis protein FimT